MKLIFFQFFYFSVTFCVTLNYEIILQKLVRSRQRNQSCRGNGNALPECSGAREKSHVTVSAVTLYRTEYYYFYDAFVLLLS